MLDFLKKSNPKFAISQLSGLLIAFLFFAAAPACDSSSQNESIKLHKEAATFTTTTNLQLEGITTPVTLRVTITRDGETVSDEIQNYEDDWIHSAAGTIPIEFIQDYELSYATHTFTFAVYYCETAPTDTDALDAAITDETAVLLGSATSTLDVDNVAENLPPVTINIAEGDQVSETMRLFFPSEPVFNSETVSASSTCATSSGQYSSLALDSESNPHISFLCEPSSTTKRLGYISQTDGSWETPWLLAEDNTATLDGTDNVGEYSAIAIDSEDGIHISYYDASNFDARYVYVAPDDTAFATSEMISSGSATAKAKGRYSAITVYESGGIVYPYVAFWDQVSTGDFATFANDLTGSWKDVRVSSFGASHRGKFSDLAFSHDDTLNVAYYSTSSGTGYLAYVNCAYDSTGWTSCRSRNANVALMNDTLEQNISLAVDSDDIVHIFYYDYSNGDLVHISGTPAQIDAGTISSEIIANGTALAGAGQYSAVAIDSSGIFHIAYYDADTTSLQYKQGNAGDDWSLITPIEIDNSADVGQFVSMKLDETTTTIHLTYYDATNKTLKYAVSE